MGWIRRLAAAAAGAAWMAAAPAAEAAGSGPQAALDRWLGYAARRPATRWTEEAWRSLVRGIIDVESRGRALAVSPKGAVGLMQVLPSTAAEVLGEGSGGTVQRCLRSARCNTVVGQRYLIAQLRAFNGNLLFALSAYNQGPGATLRHWREGKIGRSPREAMRRWPYRETRRYLASVLVATQAEHWRRTGAIHPATAMLARGRWPGVRLPPYGRGRGRRGRSTMRGRHCAKPEARRCTEAEERDAHRGRSPQRVRPARGSWEACCTPRSSTTATAA